ncbi:hypothetical protein N0V88_006825 [Collariella sp. IMI 366227]|nr:hypothetical protein N0V88_006825 [Collariella sp. IMI 366227]
MSYDPTATGARAAHFKSLHVPGAPLLLANVYDAISARAVGSLPQCRALASASWALAKSIGIDDEQLTREQNLALLQPIAAVARQLGLPLTVDIQDGYGEELEEVVRRGKKFLVAGAATVYVFWPMDKDMIEEDVKKVIDAFNGRANIQPRTAGGVQSKTLTSADVAEWGAARVSVGTQLYRTAVEAIVAKANEVFAV